MKSIRMLFIALIGMIGMTAFASTSEPEQKSKTTIHFSDPSIVSVDVANVEIRKTFVASHEFSEVVINMQKVKTNDVAAMPDVGFYFDFSRTTETPYRERLHKCKHDFIKDTGQNNYRSNC